MVMPGAARPGSSRWTCTNSSRPGSGGVKGPPSVPPVQFTGGKKRYLPGSTQNAGAAQDRGRVYGRAGAGGGEIGEGRALLGGAEGLQGGQSDEILKAIHSVSDELGMAIERSFSYLSSSGEATSVDQIYLSGGGAQIPGLKKYLEEKLSTPVDVANPLQNLAVDADAVGAEQVAVGPSLMVAIGLATRKGS